MSAIITDQLRILNAKEFVASVASTSSSYYTFVGLPNATQISSTWDISPPDPRDNFDEENNYWDTIIALKKVSSSDIKQVIRKEDCSLLVLADVKQRCVIPSPPSEDVVYAGLLHYGDLPWILYNYAEERPLDTRRKV